MKHCKTDSITSFLSTANAHVEHYFNFRKLWKHDITEGGVYIQILDRLFHLIECRNTILAIIANIDAMKSASYCGESLSMLILDSSRPDVARLVPIETSRIKALAIAFETCLFVVSSVGVHELLKISKSPTFSTITKNCDIILTELGLGTLEFPTTDKWRCTVQILDLAVVSYVSAHVGDFIHSTRRFELPGNFSDFQLFTFRQRSFQCLDNFLNCQKAWVLEQNTVSSQTSDKQLYLSTKATTFADIWGPMWASCPKTSHNTIISYNVGSGIIIPWQISPPNVEHNPVIHPGEVLCHWISEAESEKSEDLGQPFKQTLTPSSILLIGATMKLTSRVCGCSINSIKERLRDSGLLHYRGTMSKSRYKDSETVSFQVGWSGVTAGAQRSYKFRERTWKQCLIEAWKNEPEGRNPRVLEYWLGVEVSVCTRNARRQRLITLLGTQTMMNYLQGCSIGWINSDCRTEFFAAMKSDDYTSFRKLYSEHADWQSCLGKAISICLDVLSDTGTTGQGLNMFWVPSATGMEWVVTLDSSLHTWTGFLKDTKDCCTMAIFENICLELGDLTCGRRCPHGNSIGNVRHGDECSGYSVLQTAVTMNEKKVPKTMRKVKIRRRGGIASSHKYRWSVSLVEEDEKFTFGENGQLVTIGRLHKSQMLVWWKSSNVLEKLQGKLLDGIGQGTMDHHEFIRDEDWETSPVDVIITSTKSNKPSAVLFRPTKKSTTEYENSGSKRHDSVDDILPPLSQCHSPKIVEGSYNKRPALLPH